jgi:hypothetical protein
MTTDRDAERATNESSGAPGGDRGRSNPSDVSDAQTHTATSDTEGVYESDPGPTTGDTTGEDPLGADDTR